MSFEIWFAFLAATIVVLAIPGPTVMLVVSYALGRGRQTAWATVAGVALGDFTAMTLSMLGLGALLAASATAFVIVKWVGAAYLIYLGIRLWRGEPAAQQLEAAAGRDAPRRMLGHAFVVTVLNPKSILFFVAFLPQFVAADAPLLPQMVILEATFVTLAALNAALYALLAGSVRRFVRRAEVLRWINRVSGSVLVAAGLAAAAMRRAT